MFLDSRKKANLFEKFQCKGFLLSLAHLMDTFEAFNAFNLNGKSINIIKHYDIIRTFTAKLDQWKSRTQQGDPASFNNLDYYAFTDGNLEFE